MTFCLLFSSSLDLAVTFSPLVERLMSSTPAPQHPSPTATDSTLELPHAIPRRPRHGFLLDGRLIWCAQRSTKQSRRRYRNGFYGEEECVLRYLPLGGGSWRKDCKKYKKVQRFWLLHSPSRTGAGRDEIKGNGIKSRKTSCTSRKK